MADETAAFDRWWAAKGKHLRILPLDAAPSYARVIEESLRAAFMAGAAAERAEHPHQEEKPQDA